ncbi:MAG: hypothetical protein AB8I08_06175 [Sandaracinaceae bacterium]
MSFLDRFRRPDPTLVRHLRVLRARRREAAALSDAGAHDTFVAAVAKELGVPAAEVEFLCSASESYRLRAVLGENTRYDRAHRDVFRALDHLDG